MHKIQDKQILRRKNQLVKIWLELGLNRELLYDMYYEEYPYYKEFTWVMMYGWFMGEPITFMHNNAYLNELCSYRRGKILLQLTGGYYYTLKNGRREQFTVLPRTFNYVFTEESVFIYLVQRFKVLVRKVWRWVKRNETKELKKES